MPGWPARGPWPAGVQPGSRCCAHMTLSAVFGIRTEAGHASFRRTGLATGSLGIYGSVGYGDVGVAIRPRGAAMTSALLEQSAVRSSGPKALTEGKQSPGILIALWLFVVIPFLAVVAAVPVAWGGWLSWTDVSIALACYVSSGLGITVGFHRYLTLWALTKGLFPAHMGWLFQRELSNRARFAPDLVADKDIRRIDRLFPLITVASILAPAVAGGVITWSWQGALSAFFWGGLVRVSLLHHITWSINSICHVYGERPFELRDGDKAANFWPLAILSFGESWHNLHHADPTSARHGVLRGQFDSSARLIWIFEKFGWVHDVRWPKPERIAAKLAQSRGD